MRCSVVDVRASRATKHVRCAPVEAGTRGRKRKGVTDDVVDNPLFLVLLTGIELVTY